MSQGYGSSAEVLKSTIKSAEGADWLLFCARLLKRGATEDSRGSAKEERELAKEWTREVQQHMDRIHKYTNELAAGAPELHDGSTALAEAYRLGRLSENVNKEVEDARRCELTSVCLM